MLGSPKFCKEADRKKAAHVMSGQLVSVWSDMDPLKTDCVTFTAHPVVYVVSQVPILRRRIGSIHFLDPSLTCLCCFSHENELIFNSLQHHLEPKKEHIEHGLRGDRMI